MMKKSLMSKSLTITTLLSSVLFSNTIDNMVLKFEKKRISADKRIKLKNLKLLLKKDLHYNGWFGYVYDVSLSLNGKVIDIKDTIFSDGKIIAPDLKNLKMVFLIKS